MTRSNSGSSSRPVAIWLLIGVGMIVIQVLLGGITRLTGSGLSITEWKPIMGAIPPLNEQDWIQAFEKYKQIGQYKYLNTHFTLSDFKFIFFWEWFHRLWARLIGVVFLLPFIYFLIKKSFKQEMIRPLLILFLWGALQGLAGWIMVKSGLEDSESLYVSHYKLAIHFILALGLLCYTLWFSLQLLVPKEQIMEDKAIHRNTVWLIGLLTIQLIYGAFMAGLKAVKSAPTWPKINDGWLPHPVRMYGGRSFTGLSYLTENPLVIQFIHRLIAYLLLVFISYSWWKARKRKGTKLFNKTRVLPIIIVWLQVILGICTVLNPFHPQLFLWLGVMHQLVAMLLLLSLVWILFIVRKQPSIPITTI